MIYHLYDPDRTKYVYTDILTDEDAWDWEYLGFRNDVDPELPGWFVDLESGYSATTARDLCQCYEIQMWEVV